MIQKKGLKSPKSYSKPREPELNVPKSASAIVGAISPSEDSIKGLLIRERIGSVKNDTKRKTKKLQHEHHRQHTAQLNPSDTKKSNYSPLPVSSSKKQRISKGASGTALCENLSHLES